MQKPGVGWQMKVVIPLIVMLHAQEFLFFLNCLAQISRFGADDAQAWIYSLEKESVKDPKGLSEHALFTRCRSMKTRHMQCLLLPLQHIRKFASAPATAD